MLFFKHRMNELYVHQLHTQHKILHQSGFYIIINKIVSVSGASSRLVLGDGEREEGEATKRDKYGSPCTKSTVNEVLTDLYSVIRSSAFIESTLRLYA